MVHESFVRLLILTIAILLTGGMTFSGSTALSSLEDEVVVDEAEAVETEEDLRISVVDNAFEDPDTGLFVSQISAGDTVRWFWEEGNLPHTVTHVSSLNSEGFDSGPRSFDDEPENDGEPFEVTFDEPDVIQYTCTIHVGMDGILVVV